jgi:hypothetical protein
MAIFLLAQCSAENISKRWFSIKLPIIAQNIGENRQNHSIGPGAVQ